MTRAEAIRIVERSEGRRPYHANQVILYRLNQRCMRCSGDGWVCLTRKKNTVRCRMCGGR